jgi:ankyrin repeat protein
VVSIAIPHRRCATAEGQEVPDALAGRLPRHKHDRLQHICERPDQPGYFHPFYLLSLCPFSNLNSFLYFIIIPFFSPYFLVKHPTPFQMNRAVDLGGDVNYMEPSFGMTGLHIAVSNNYTDMVKALLRVGAESSCTNTQQHACACVYTILIALLLLCFCNLISPASLLRSKS